MGCICGGKIYDYLNIQNIKVIKQVSEGMQDEKMDEEKKGETANETEDQEKGFYSSSEQLQKLETELQNLKEENIKLKQDKMKLKQKIVIMWMIFQESLGPS